MQDLLNTLCALKGTSGDEGSVRNYIIEKIAHAAGCTYTIDAPGNLIVEKKGARTPKNRLLFAAHMDEVGFIVTGIDDHGMLLFDAVGGISPSVVVGKRVLVGERELPGVIGVKPVHLCTGDERDAVPELGKLTIDIGAADRKEAVSAVLPGDRAVFDGVLTKLGDGCVAGRALDDRVGCAMMVELIRGDLPCDCAFAFTVQEETGCVGARTAGYSAAPDIAVVLEATAAGDIEGAPAHKAGCRLGEGPAVSFMDKGTIYTKELYRAAADAAAQAGVRWQYKQGVYAANDASRFQTSRAGARCLAVSLPCRYLHSPSCMLSMKDVGETMRLLPALIERFGDLA